MLSISTANREYEEQNKYDLDFLYQQIKELRDKLDEYNNKNGNSKESESLLRGFIIEKKKKEGFPLFKNDIIFISISDYEVSSDTPLKLEIQIISPILLESTNAPTKEKNFRLNISDIENFIKKFSKGIYNLELAIKEGFYLDENDGKKISKKIFFDGDSEEIAILRAEILKLSLISTVLTVKQVNLNFYNIIFKNFQVSVNISSNYLIIEGNLDNIENILEIYPTIEEIITKNKELFGKKDSSKIQEESKLGIKKIFSFGNTQKDPSILEIGNKKLKDLLLYSQKQIPFLNKFKANLEADFLDDLNKFDKNIINEIKNITIELIDYILPLIEEIVENKKSSQIIYVGYLLDILHRGIVNGDLLKVYQYIINNDKLELKYGEKIKSKILENGNYKGKLSSNLFSVGPIENYNYLQRKNHNTIFSPDNMQIVSTSFDYKIKSYNIVLGKEQESSKLKTLSKKNCRTISTDGKYLLTYKYNFFQAQNSHIIYNLENGDKIKLGERFSRTQDTLYRLYNHYLISICNSNRTKYLYIYDIDNGTEQYMDIAIGMDYYTICGDVIYFFETNRQDIPTKFNSYNLSTNKSKSLDLFINSDETPLEIISNNHQIFVILMNKEEKLFIRQIDIREDNLENSHISDYNINGLKDNYNIDYTFISDDGYILLQSKNDLYIINTNTNLLYKYTPNERINHFFKVQFINSIKYGHFAIARDGNQIFKIDIGLIENLIEPIDMKEINNQTLEKKQKEEKKLKNEIEKGRIIQLTEIEEANKDGLEELGERDLQREIVAELRETRAINTMILQELKHLREENQKMRKIIEGLND